jgi:DNA repair protein RadC
MGPPALPGLIMAGGDGGADKPDYLGHRKRLRERLLAGGTEPLPDYELIELVLQTANARADTKGAAKALLKRFGDIPGVLGAGRDALKEVDGMGDAAVATLMAVRELAVRMARASVAKRPVISSWQQLLDYCNVAAGHGETEEFRILFLDRKNALIADERQSQGTVDHVPVYPREVVRRVLALGASAVIMVHNHPSGDTTPSKGDVEMTRAVAKALAAVGVEIHDHVVIGRGRHSSFKTLGLL